MGRLEDKFLAAAEQEVTALKSGALQLLQYLSDRLNYTLQSWGSFRLQAFSFRPTG